MKQIIITIFTLFVTLTASAMDDGRLELINSIKKDSCYLYSDVTTPTIESATSIAYEQLQRTILDWALTQDLRDCFGTVSVVTINSFVDTITTRRANMFRVFAYVRKADMKNLALGIDEEPMIEVDDEESLADLEDEEPMAEVEDKRPSADVEEKTQDAVVSKQVCKLLMQSFLGRNGDILEKIKQAKTFFDLKQIMEPLKQSGDIIDYGKYLTADKPEECYLIVYDPAGNIRALLGLGKDKRKNLKTGEDDNIANYRGCGAIWFKLE